MEIVFFNDDKAVNTLKAISIEDGKSVEGNLRDSTSILTPEIRVTDNAFPDHIVPYNMFYVPIWKRYYFISDIVFSGNIIYISGTEDMLSSWIDELIHQTFYCLRSASYYDKTITDTRFPAKCEQQIKTCVLQGGNPWSSFKEGVYVLALSSGGTDFHVGSNIYYIIDSSQMSDFMGKLLETALESISAGEFGDAIVKLMCDPISYIRSCFYFPFKPEVSTTTTDSVKFGWWESDMEADIYEINSDSDTYAELTIPLTYDSELYSDTELNYKKLPPYSKLVLTAYPFGMIEMPLQVVQKYIEMEDLELVIRVDLLTGMCSLAVEVRKEDLQLFYTTCQLGVEIPVAQVVQQFFGSLGAGVGTAAAALSGNVAGAALGTISAINNLAPEVTSEGDIGGLAQLLLTQDWRLTRYYYEVNDYPDTEGSPCCKNTELSILGGYAIFDHAYVEGSMLDSEKKGIQSLLESGVNIEWLV